MIFEILGFDIMLDSNGKAYLLEVNHSPSFHAKAPLDKRIKWGLIDDTLTLLNLSVPRKTAYIKKHTEEFQKWMLTGKQLKYTPEERKQLAMRFNEERDEYEAEAYKLGNYKLIYPNNAGPCPYKKFLKLSKAIWEEFNFGAKP